MRKKYETQIIKWFELFHQIPEVSWEEVMTTKKITQILDDLDVSYHTFSDITGLVAEMGDGDETIAVRVGIDAIRQKVDGKYKAMHSCANDAHIAMLLGAIKYLKDLPLNKKIRFIFQPGEESGDGALRMIERGVIDDVTYLFGIHLRPIEDLPLGMISPATHHGAAQFLEGRVFGVDAHGARPHQGKSAIDVLVSLYQFIQTIHITPTTPHSIKFTKIVTDGESRNTIPGIAEFAIDLRAQNSSMLRLLQKQATAGIHTIKSLHGTDIQFTWSDIVPGADVSIDAQEIATAAIREVVGDDGYAEPIILTTSDDFHYYTAKNPKVKATMIALGADLSHGLHDPDMSFDTSALDIGARVLAETLYRA